MKICKLTLRKYRQDLNDDLNYSTIQICYLNTRYSDHEDQLLDLNNLSGLRVKYCLEHLITGPEHQISWLFFNVLGTMSNRLYQFIRTRADMQRSKINL